MHHRTAGFGPPFSFGWMMKTIRYTARMTSPQDQAPSQAATLQQQLQRGYELLGQRRFDDASSLAEWLLTTYPRQPAALVFVAETRFAHGDMDGAMRHTDEAIIASGGDPSLRIRKLLLHSQMRRRADIPALANDISRQLGNNGPLRWELGKLFHRNNLQAEAIKEFGLALGLMGDDPGILYDRATAYFFSGNFSAAEADLDRMLTLVPQAGSAYYLRATLRKQTAASNHVYALERQLAAGFQRTSDEAATLYALAKELEDLGQHERAFAALGAGARKQRDGMRHYDVAAECASLQAIQDAYHAQVMAAATTGHDESGAIFIVGMPRSGTTLVERILVQSGKVVSAGELMDFGRLLGDATQKVIDANPAQTQAQASLQIDFGSLGREYMRGAREAASGSPLFIDKLPVNYLYCGMIRKALPNARIIHLVRDPLDSCYAVYKTLFFTAYSFSYDLEELADYYIAYRRMMEHWHAVMPGRILDVRYEDLVSDTEAQTQRIFEWCGLPWDPAVLETPTGDKVFATASAAQVREPIHARSVGSARRHAARLAPLADRLVKAGMLPADWANSA